MCIVGYLVESQRPVNKKGYKISLQRPISLTWIRSKVVEHIVTVHAVSLKPTESCHHDSLTLDQNRTCKTQLKLTVEGWAKALDLTGDYLPRLNLAASRLSKDSCQSEVNKSSCLYEQFMPIWESVTSEVTQCLYSLFCLCINCLVSAPTVYIMSDIQSEMRLSANNCILYRLQIRIFYITS